MAARLCLRTILVILIFGGAQVNSATLPIYSYHSDPPFELPQIATDLSQSWVDEFNRYSETVKLELVRIERPRLNKIVESGQPYLILWANSAWFKKRDNNIKASDIIFWDADIWVSNKVSPVRYQEPRDLLDKRVGAREGFYYKGVSPLMEKGDITRIDNLSDKENYQQLTESQLDVYVMSRSSFMYWLAHGMNTDELFVAQSPHDAFTRHMLFSHHHENIAPLINNFIRHMKADRKWQTKLKFWGVDKLVDPFELELDELINFSVKSK